MEYSSLSSSYLYTSLLAVEDPGEKVELAPDDFDTLASEVDAEEPLYIKLKTVHYPVFPYDGIPEGLISLPDHAQDESELPREMTVLIPKRQSEVRRLFFSRPRTLSG